MASDRLNIDMGRLDKEWAQQPDIYHEAAKELADKRADLDTAKARLDVVAAECGKDIRAMPSKFDISAPRVTEKMVEDAVLLHPEYQSALKRMNKLKHDVGILQAMVEALDHKKKALEHLVQLFLSDYFSSPKKVRGGDDGRFANARKAEVRSRSQRRPNDE